MTADPKAISSVPRSEQDCEKVSDEFSLLREPPKKESPARPVNIWLLRLRSLLFVTLCASFGVLLLILPWTPKWTDNPLLISLPQLRAIVSSGFVRGVSTGLGVLDLWLGFWEAIHYHERTGQ